MKQDRIDRAQSISKKIIGEYFSTNARELSSTFGIITITYIEISSDLSYMDIYVSSLMQQDGLTKELAQHAHALQRILGKEIAFIKVPKIRFKYDSSGKESSDIYTTIKNLNS